MLNNELYVIGGCFNQALEENIHPFGFRYNPRTNKWTTMAPMHRERCRFSLSVLGGQLYAVGGASEAEHGEGGEGGEGVSACERYSPVSDTWSSLPPLPGPRSQHAAATLQGALYVCGGLEGDAVVDSCWSYVPEHEVWVEVAPMLRPRADHCCLSYGGRLYVCGGWYEDEAHTRVLLDTIECYDPDASLWRVVARVPTPRYHAGMVVTGSRLAVIGGFHSDATFDRATGVIECYDLDTGTWSSEPPYPQVRCRRSIALHRNYLTKGCLC